MTNISAEMVCDSISEAEVRVSTLSLKLPRPLLPEFLTHRSFCRNASSNRAQPTKKKVEAVMSSPFLPLHLGLNQRGMQAMAEIEDPRKRRAVYHIWKQALRGCVKAVEELDSLYGLHKQVVNRLLEPFDTVSILVTATDWDNFLALRCHPAAEPHIFAAGWLLADQLYGPSASTPSLVQNGGWHLPYVSEEEKHSLSLEDQKIASSARSARVSYNLHDGGTPTIEKDRGTYGKLTAGLESGDPLEPGHLSPLEHPCTPLINGPLAYSGPLRGWKSFRKFFDRERMEFDYEAAVGRGWRDKAMAILAKVNELPYPEVDS